LLASPFAPPERLAVQEARAPLLEAISPVCVRSERGLEAVELVLGERANPEGQRRVARLPVVSPSSTTAEASSRASVRRPERTQASTSASTKGRSERKQTSGGAAVRSPRVGY
jgi:hypothetical protein